MFNNRNKKWLAAGLFATSFGIFAASSFLGNPDQNGAMLSTGAIAAFLAVLGLAAIGGRLHSVAGGAMAIGAWSLVAPVVLGFTSDPALWIHMFAGLLAMSIGILSSELSGRRPPPALPQADRHGRLHSRRTERATRRGSIKRGRATQS